MDYSQIDPHLRKIAEIANTVIKQRYNLPNGNVLMAINHTVPLLPTLHWKTSTEYIICEVADRPYPVVVKMQYSDIAATGLPIRIIVAFPHDHGLSGSDFNKDQKTLKALGIGYMSVNEVRNTNIDYQGVCVNQKIDQLDLQKFPKAVRKQIQEAYECYMIDGKPDVGVQKVGQLTENLLHNAAVDAKKKGHFVYQGFSPPKFINFGDLTTNLRLENILGLGLIDRCKDFGKARNAVSHSPKSIKAAIAISKENKENFSLGLKLVVDIVADIKNKGYNVKA